MPLYPQGGGLYPDSISNDILADMPENTVKGRAAGTGTGNPTDIPMSALVAASAGLSYRNILGRNGGFEVWQRGAGGTGTGMVVAAGTGQYTADGWYLQVGANQASAVAQGAGIVVGSRFSILIQRNAGQTGVGTVLFEFPLDTDECVTMRGKIVTLSLTLRAGANWSPAGGNVLAILYTGTGTPAKRSLGVYTGDASPLGLTAAVTTTETRFTVTSLVPVGAAITCASLLLTWTPVGTAGAADTISIDDVQLEIGTVATPFERRPFESELLACQRHYWKTFSYNIAPASSVGFVAGHMNMNVLLAGAATDMGQHRFAVPMRASPTIVFYNPNAAGSGGHNLSRTLNGGAGVAQNPTAEQFVWYSVGHASNVVGDQIIIHATADAGI